MSDDLDAILMDPTRCYVRGCEAENEILVHLADEPWGGADLCLHHARETFASTPLMWTCGCSFCDRARTVLGRHSHDGAVVLCFGCTGRWLMTTESGSKYLLDLDAQTARRVQDYSNTTPSHERVWSQPLRRDDETLPLLELGPVTIGQGAVLSLGQVDNYDGYVSTTRLTTAVINVEQIGGE